MEETPEKLVLHSQSDGNGLVDYHQLVKLLFNKETAKQVCSWNIDQERYQREAFVT